MDSAEADVLAFMDFPKEHRSKLGVRLDPAANLAADRQISRADSSVRVLMIPTDEQVVIAEVRPD